LCLDCKDVDAGLLARQILEARMEHQVVVSAEPDVLKQIQHVCGARVALMPRWRPDLGVDPWLDELQPAVVEVHADALTPEVCGAFHERGVFVTAKMTNDSDQPDGWEKALAAGADWIRTGLPEELVAHVTWKRLTKRPVRIAMHRGASRYAPENTLPAYEKAIRMGADLVEFDVRTASDGGLFLLHDGDLDRTTNGSGPLSHVSSEVLARLDAGAWFGRPFVSTRMPTLDQFLDAVGDRVDLYFDAKDIAPETLARVLDERGLVEKTVVYNGPEYLRRLREIDPRIRLLPPLGDPAELEQRAAELKPYACDTAWEILSQELIDRCHTLGIRVFSDAIGEHETIADYQQAIGWGIDVIQTDYPLRVMRAVELLEAEAGEGSPKN
jgi:glycerophosphoryl diester phosphodiesterase